MSTILTTPEFDLSQIINGVTVMVPSPFGFHQKLSMKLSYLIQNFLEKNPHGEIFAAPLDVVLEKDINVLQPDLIYIKKENMSIFHPDGHIHGVPDLLVEIVSSSSISRDTVDKFRIYEKYGVYEYWIVFPEQKVIEVFVLKEGKYSLICSTENTEGVVSSLVLQDFKLNVSDIFEGFIL
jgi:Uma2 family endonuclease